MKIPSVRTHPEELLACIVWESTFLRFYNGDLLYIKKQLGLADIRPIRHLKVEDSYFLSMKNIMCKNSSQRTARVKEKFI